MHDGVGGEIRVRGNAHCPAHVILMYRVCVLGVAWRRLIRSGEGRLWTWLRL